MKTAVYILSVALVLAVIADGTEARWTWGDVACAAVGGALAVVGAPVVMTAAGFTAGGVAVSSLAAGVQSVVYGAATTGAFSVAQSAGAAGLGLAGKAAVAGIGAAVGAAAAGDD